MSLRFYYESEVPQVGDVVCCFGLIPEAFNCGIITEIDREKDLIVVTRPHAQVSARDSDSSGQLSIGLETIKYTTDSLYKNVQVYLRGKDLVDNRRYFP